MQRGHIMVQLARQKLGFGLKEDANENSDEWVSNSVISSEDDGGPITSMFRLAKQHGVKGNANKENSAALVTNTMESQGDRGRQLRYLRQENKALRQYIKISTNPLNCFPCSSLLSSNDCSSQETAVLGKAIPDSAVPSLTSRNNTSDVLVGTDDGRHTLSTVDGVLENVGINVIRRSARVRKKTHKVRE